MASPGLQPTRSLRVTDSRLPKHAHDRGDSIQSCIRDPIPHNRYGDDGLPLGVPEAAQTHIYAIVKIIPRT